MRADLDVVASLVPRGSRVLDLGCGDGTLLDHLIRARGCEGHGVATSADGFDACVARGVPVVEADIDSGIAAFEDGTFDLVVLSQTLQSTRRPRFVLGEMLRVGGAGIVSFPNFGHWRLRARLALGGRMPSSGVLPYAWYETPNIHLCTILDFDALVRDMGLAVRRRIALHEAGRELTGAAARRPNLFAARAIYLIQG
jgi:methionine biosynthesis protein MetW